MHHLNTIDKPEAKLRLVLDLCKIQQKKSEFHKRQENILNVK